jgi:hypothetical protein
METAHGWLLIVGLRALAGDRFGFVRQDSSRLWDIATAKPLGAPIPHQGSMLAAAFPPGASQVLLVTEDKTTLAHPVGGAPEVDDQRIGLWLKLATCMDLSARGEAVLLEPETWEVVPAPAPVVALTALALAGHGSSKKSARPVSPGPRMLRTRVAVGAVGRSARHSPRPGPRRSSLSVHQMAPGKKWLSVLLWFGRAGRRYG